MNLVEYKRVFCQEQFNEWCYSGKIVIGVINCFMLVILCLDQRFYLLEVIYDQKYKISGKKFIIDNILRFRRGFVIGI